MPDVNPTRMELIKTKDRISLAKKGHKLLKQKRDALILEFFKILKKAQDLRGELAKKMSDGQKSLALAEIYHNEMELSRVSMQLKREIDIDLTVRNVMGVKIPSLESKMPEKKLTEESLVGTSAKIDAAAEEFNSVLSIAMKLAETETAMKRLIIEIEKTKRRVNALEYVLIPALDEQKNMISLRLSEMERDSFVSLKAIKRSLEKKKLAATTTN